MPTHISPERDLRKHSQTLRYSRYRRDFRVCALGLALLPLPQSFDFHALLPWEGVGERGLLRRESDHEKLPHPYQAGLPVGALDMRQGSGDSVMV